MPGLPESEANSRGPEIEIPCQDPFGRPSTTYVSIGEGRRVVVRPPTIAGTYDWHELAQLRAALRTLQNQLGGESA